MNCVSFRGVAVEVARARATGVRQDALAHADNCPDCAAFLADQQALSESLRAYQTKAAALHIAPVRLEENLRAFFRSQSAVAESELARQRRAGNLTASRIWPRSFAAPGAAAAAVVATILVTFAPHIYRHAERTTHNGSGTTSENSLSPSRDNQGGDGHAITQAPINSNTLVRKATFEIQSTPRKRTARSIARHRPDAFAAPDQKSTSVPQTEEAASEEIATDFFTLAESASQNPLEGGQIVRVEVPRSTLMSFGLPVNMERASEAAKAEVLLGHDGVARAIRFVK